MTLRAWYKWKERNMPWLFCSFPFLFKDRIIWVKSVFERLCYEKQIGFFSSPVEKISIDMVICLQPEQCWILMSQLRLKQGRSVDQICFLSEINLKWLFIILLLGQYEMIDKPRTNWELSFVTQKCRWCLRQDEIWRLSRNLIKKKIIIWKQNHVI